MKRIAFTTLLALALVASACHKNEKNQAPVPTPNSGTVKPEIPTSHEVSGAATPNPVSSPSAEVAEEVEDEFGGTPHDSSCTEDHLGVGMGLLEGGQIDDAIAELEKGVFDEPENFDIRKALATAYIEQGELEKAVGHLRLGLEQVDDGGAWQMLAQTYFDLKDFDQAERAIRHAAKDDPSSAEPFRLLARVYQSRDMWKESIEASEEAIARGSDSPWTFNNLGYAYLVLGKTDDAVRELEKAVSFDVGVTPSIWNNLGLAYEKKGELADAANAYRAALAGNPGYVKAKVNLKRLTEVARANGVPIGERSAGIGAEVKSSPAVAPTATPAEIEGAAIGEKTDGETNP